VLNNRSMVAIFAILWLKLLSSEQFAPKSPVLRRIPSECTLEVSAEMTAIVKTDQACDLLDTEKGAFEESRCLFHFEVTQVPVGRKRCFGLK